MKILLKVFISVSLILLFAACDKENTSEKAYVITLDETGALFNGNKLKEYDYTWNINIEDGKEYYEGEKPDGDIYVAHDIYYFPLIDEKDFVVKKYNGDKEWVTYCKKEEYKNYIFGTLPKKSEKFPNNMMHTSEEAYENKVLHITKAGNYFLEGKWHGQVLIDLGKDAYDNEKQKVKIILNGVDITCDVGPAILFNNVYECDNAFKDRNSYTNEVDTSNAGARIIIADDSTNNIVGSNVFRMLKPKFKDEKEKAQSKRFKLDSTIFSLMSLEIDAEEKQNGVLNITSTTYEGLGSELHLTINGGIINIQSQDDGINVNEEDVSVFTMNDGTLTISAGNGAEGDAIDSNGYIVINGGTVDGTSPSVSDYMFDSNCGTTISHSAKIIADVAGGIVEKKPNNIPLDFKPNKKFPEPK